MALIRQAGSTLHRQKRQGDRPLFASISQMTLFEYLGVLLSIVMGLGVTHLLSGASNVIHHRDTVRFYWVHMMWTVNVLIYILAIWWGMFWWRSLESWSFFQFLFIVLYAITLFLLSAMLYPRNFADDYDFKEHFLNNRRWFFSLFFLAWCIDIPETTLKAGSGLRDLPPLYFAFAGTMLVFSLTAVFTRSERFHAFFSVFWLVALISYLGVTTLSEIAT